MSPGVFDYVHQEEYGVTAGHAKEGDGSVRSGAKPSYAQRATEVLERSILESVGKGLAAGVADEGIPDWVHARMDGLRERAEARLADEMRAAMPEELASDAEARAEFVSLYSAFWRPALDLFWLVRTHCAKLGSWLNDLPAGDETPVLNDVSTVMRDVQARACRVASEVHVLLSTGLREGAEARARTLYELDVVTSVIAQADDPEDTARRYLAHERWERLRDLRMWVEAGRATEDDLRELRAIEAAVEALVGTCDGRFARPWGWAADLVDGRPTFRSLEALAGHGAVHGFYMKMCHSVHGGSTGAALGIVDSPDGPTLTTGQEEELPTDAAAGSLLALCRVTSRVVDARSEACAQSAVGVWLGAVERLRDEATCEFEARRRDLEALLRRDQIR